MNQELYGITEFLIERAKKVLSYDSSLGKVYFIMRYPDDPKLKYFNIDIEMVYNPIAISILSGIVKAQWGKLKPTRPDGTVLVAVIMLALTQVESKTEDQENSGRMCILTTVHTHDNIEALMTYINQSGDDLAFEKTTTMEGFNDAGIIRDLFPKEQPAPQIFDIAPIDAIVEQLKSQAKKLFEKNKGELEPKMYFVLLYPEQQTPVYFPIPCSKVMQFAGGTSKMPEYAQLCWWKKKAESPVGVQLLAVCMVSDTWLSSRPIGAPHIQPSKDPSRQEALVMTICYPTQTSIKTIPYERKGNRIAFKEELPNQHKKIGGSMTMLYPKHL